MGELRGRRAEGEAPVTRADGVATRQPSGSGGPSPDGRTIGVVLLVVVGASAVWTLGLPALGVPLTPWVSELVQGIVNASLQTVGCVLLFRGASIQTGRRRAAWATISFGALTGAVGSWIWSTVLLATRHHPEQGTVDALYAAALFLTTVGVAMLPPSEQRSRRVRTVDTAILMLTALTLVWVTPVHQQVDGRVIAGFPTIGVFEVVTVVTIMVAVGAVARCRPDRHGEIALMASALAASGVGMLLYASAPEGYPTSSRVADVVFALGFVLAGAAGMRLRGPVRTLRRRGTDRTRHWLALPEIATVTTLVALTLHERVDTTTVVSLSLGAVAVALAIARLLQLRVEQRRLSQSLHDSADLLYREARTDALTGLGNRLGFDEHLRTTLERQSRAELDERRHVTVMFIDVDHFKRFNDALGHAIGDGLLVEVARRIVSTDEVQAYRVGGDEFVAVATGVDSSGATELAARLVHAFDEPVVVDDHEMAVTVSIGSASWDAVGDEPPAAGELVRRADLALYRSKELGRATWTAYDPALAARAERQHLLRQGLQRAAEHDELDVVFEPVVALRGHRLVGAVAALQWRSEFGLVGEDVIGPVAVEGGLVGATAAALFDRTRRALVRTTSTSTDASGTPMWVGVRLTREELVHPAVSTLIMECIDHPAIDPGRLHVDITEDTVVDDTAMEVIAALRQLGVHLTVEQFGTGPSSLLRLRDYPAATIRLDRSFVGGLGRRRDDTMVVTAVSGLAADLGIELSADGVDEEFQATYLEGLGVTTGRGRLFGDVLDADQLAGLAGAVMTCEDPELVGLGR